MQKWQKRMLVTLKTTGAVFNLRCGNAVSYEVVDNNLLTSNKAQEFVFSLKNRTNLCSQNCYSHCSVIILLDFFWFYFYSFLRGKEGDR